MATGSTWRPHPFVAGRRYVALESFAAYTDGLRDTTFVAGTAYEFTAAGYSRYDSATVFSFRTTGNGEPIYWWWRDDEDDGLCSLRFRQVP